MSSFESRAGRGNAAPPLVQDINGINGIVNAQYKLKGRRFGLGRDGSPKMILLVRPTCNVPFNCYTSGYRVSCVQPSFLFEARAPQNN